MTQHNGFSPEERHALLMDHVRQEVEWQERLKVIKDERNKGRKIARADGFSLAELDFAYKTVMSSDQNIQVESTRARINVLQGLSVIPAGEPDLFAERRDADERQYDEGKADGLAGKDAPPATEQEKLRGWTDGQEILASAFKKKEADSAEQKAKDNEIIPTTTGDDDAPLSVG